MFQPTRSAVATSCVGGPDCAPIQASAVLSRSSSKCSSSRRVGAGEELPRQLQAVEAGRLPDAPEGAAEVASSSARPGRPRRRARCGPTSRGRRRGRRRRRGVPQTLSIDAQVRSRSTKKWMPSSPNGAKPHGSRSWYSRPTGVEVEVLDDAGVADHDVRARAAVHPVAGEALDRADTAPPTTVSRSTTSTSGRPARGSRRRRARCGRRRRRRPGRRHTADTRGAARAPRTTRGSPGKRSAAHEVDPAAGPVEAAGAGLGVGRGEHGGAARARRRAAPPAARGRGRCPAAPAARAARRPRRRRRASPRACSGVSAARTWSCHHWPGRAEVAVGDADQPAVVLPAASARSPSCRRWPRGSPRRDAGRRGGTSIASA